jgi:hypothetical protein
VDTTSPGTQRGRFRLTDDYISAATQDVETQLAKAGVRLF